MFVVGNAVLCASSLLISSRCHLVYHCLFQSLNSELYFRLIPICQFPLLEVACHPSLEVERSIPCLPLPIMCQLELISAQNLRHNFVNLSHSDLMGLEHPNGSARRTELTCCPVQVLVPTPKCIMHFCINLVCSADLFNHRSGRKVPASSPNTSLWCCTTAGLRPTRQPPDM